MCCKRYRSSVFIFLLICSGVLAREDTDSLLSPYGLYVGVIGGIESGGVIATLHPFRRLSADISGEYAWDSRFFGGALGVSFYAILTHRYTLTLSAQGIYSYFPMNTTIDNYPIEKGASLFSVSPALGVEYFFPREKVAFRLDLGYVKGKRSVPYKSGSILNETEVTVYTYDIERNPVRVALSCRFRLAGKPHPEK